MPRLKTHKSFSGVTEFYEHDSEATKTKMKFSAFLPEKPIKGSLIWLSGLTCNEENFITKAGAQKKLSELGIAVFCPDTSPRGLELPQEHDDYDFGSGAGFYVDATSESYCQNYNMYSYINEEFYGQIQKHFCSGPIGISGHSMGGHGALVIGLKNPSQYQSISAFAPIVNPLKCPWGQKAFQGYFKDSSEGENYDACHLLKLGQKHSNPILIDQGTDDSFLKEQLLTENMEKAAAEAGQSLKVNYRDGYDHSYYFISTFIDDHIQHFANTL